MQTTSFNACLSTVVNYELVCNDCLMLYYMLGNFGKYFNLAVWRIIKTAKLNSHEQLKHDAICNTYICAYICASCSQLKHKN